VDGGEDFFYETRPFANKAAAVSFFLRQQNSNNAVARRQLAHDSQAGRKVRKDIVCLDNVKV